MTAARELAGLVDTLDWAALDEQVRERSRELLVDHLAVGVDGQRTDSARAVRNVAGSTGGGSAGVIGTALTADPAWAALANGSAAHARELDDCDRESSLHPGVAVIPAALAMAEDTDADMASLMAAIVAGYEVTMRVGSALNPASAYARGFHPTGVAGVFGAATAAGRLIGLDPDRQVAALGIAGTMASGSLEYLSDGSWTKRLNPGWSAHGGVVAARLAAEGHSGPATVFEGPLGVLRAHSDEPQVERLTAELGVPLQILRVAIKPYACCRYSHGVIDCMLSLRTEHDLPAEQVEELELGILTHASRLVSDPIDVKRKPQTIVDAQFSAPFAAAVALVHGGAGPEHYTEATLADEDVRALMARTSCYHADELDRGYPAGMPAAVSARLKDGRTLTASTRFPLGEPENPLSRPALIARFGTLAGPVLGEEEAVGFASELLDADPGTKVRAALASMAAIRRADWT
jgi:2-methylcitrate dehydratase PrpD